MTHSALLKRCASLFAVILLFYFLFDGIEAATSLNVADYFKPFLFPYGFRRPAAWVGLVLVLGMAIFRGKALRWKRIDPSGTVRKLVFGVALINTWIFATYPNNHYFAQEHLGDRLLLVFFLIGLWKHPLFCFFSYIQSLLLILQFNYPVFDDWHWVDKRMGMDVLLLFCCFLIVRAFVRMPSRNFFALTLALVGADYASAALSKCNLGESWFDWVLTDNLGLLMLNAHRMGFELWSEETLYRLTEFTGQYPYLVVAPPLIIEFLGLAIFWSRRASMGILVLIVLMHAGIFLSSGILFLFWALVDLLLVWLLWKAPKHFMKPLFNNRGRALGTVMVLIGLFLLKPGDFAWFDTRICAQWQFEATTIDGEKTWLDRTDYGLYSPTMVQCRFMWISGEPVVVETWGTQLNQVPAQVINHAPLEKLREILTTLEPVPINRPRKDSFADFLWRYEANARLNETSLPLRFLTVLAPPRHFQVRPKQPVYDRKTRLQAIKAVYFLDYSARDKVIPLQRKVIPMMVAD